MGRRIQWLTEGRYTEKANRAGRRSWVVGPALLLDLPDAGTDGRAGVGYHFDHQRGG